MRSRRRRRAPPEVKCGSHYPFRLGHCEAAPAEQIHSDNVGFVSRAASSLNQIAASATDQFHLQSSLLFTLEIGVDVMAFTEHSLLRQD